MNNQNYTASFTVDQPPEEVFAAVNNVRGWWSEEIEGSTEKLGAGFKYHYKDVHRCAFKITEFAPGKKVVWHVADNYFNFVADKSEWTGTDVVFEIARKGDKTEVHFTHIGLVPAYECYDVCSDAWGSYITGSLRDLIVTGKGQPNPLEELVSKTRQVSNSNFTTYFTVDQSPKEVFDAINNVRGWWTGAPGIEGSADKLGDEFTYRYEPYHYSKQKITPGKKVVWHVSDARINFVKDKAEWDGTDIVFEITRKGDKTELRFTHVGLVPAIECYGGCSGAWVSYINDSLRSLITTGEGQPAKKEEEVAETVSA
jgi:uncharacterized protein YndB with AHSA1/START domain